MIKSITKERIQQSGRWSKSQVRGVRSVDKKGGRFKETWLITSTYSGLPRVLIEELSKKIISFSAVASYSVGKGEELSWGRGVK